MSCRSFRSPVIVAAQLSGAVLGVWAAHLMFDLPLCRCRRPSGSAAGQWFAESIATFGLLATIFGCLACRQPRRPYAVGLYITAAYWFTASTSFANPAVTVARALSDTFAGIAPPASRLHRRADDRRGRCPRLGSLALSSCPGSGQRGYADNPSAWTPLIRCWPGDGWRRSLLSSSSPCAKTRSSMDRTWVCCVVPECGSRGGRSCASP